MIVAFIGQAFRFLRPAASAVRNVRPSAATNSTIGPVRSFSRSIGPAGQRRLAERQAQRDALRSAQVNRALDRLQDAAPIAAQASPLLNRLAGPLAVVSLVADLFQFVQDNFNPIERLREAAGIPSPSQLGAQPTPATFLPVGAGLNDTFALSPISVPAGGGTLFITKQEARWPNGRFSFASVSTAGTFTFSRNVVNAGFGDVYWQLLVFFNGVRQFSDGRINFSFAGTLGNFPQGFITGIEVVPNSGPTVQYQGEPAFTPAGDTASAKPAIDPSAFVAPTIAPSTAPAIAPSTAPQVDPEILPIAPPQTQPQRSPQTQPQRSPQSPPRTPATAPVIPQIVPSPSTRPSTQPSPEVTPDPDRSPSPQIIPSPQRPPQPSPLVPITRPDTDPAVRPLPIPINPPSPIIVDPTTREPIPTNRPNPNTSPIIPVIVTEVIRETVTDRVVERVPIITTITNTIVQTPPQQGNCPTIEIPEFQCNFGECSSVTLCEPERSWLERAGGIVYSGAATFPSCEKLFPDQLPLETEWEDFGPQAILEAINAQNQAIDRVLTWICKLADQEPSLAVPEWWPIVRSPQRRQMVIAYRPRLPDGTLGMANRQITIPHYSGTGAPFAPTYTSGPYYALATLSDNSKIHVYGNSEAEARRVAEIMLSQVDPAFRSDTVIRSGRVSGKPVEESQRVPYKWILWPNGQEGGLAADSGFF